MKPRPKRYVMVGYLYVHREAEPQSVPWEKVYFEREFRRKGEWRKGLGVKIPPGLPWDLRRSIWERLYEFLEA